MNDNLPTPDPLTFIREAIDDVGAYLAMWANRDASPAPARVAATLTLERIDGALDRLLLVRANLIRELAEFDREGGEHS